MEPLNNSSQQQYAHQYAHNSSSVVSSPSSSSSGGGGGSSIGGSSSSTTDHHHHQLQNAAVQWCPMLSSSPPQSQPSSSERGGRRQNIPDLCLLALFRQMPLRDQLTARNVCRRWSDLMLSVTRKRRHLKLCISPNYERYAQNKWDTLGFSRLSSLNLVNLITSTYTGTENLRIEITHITNNDVRLLARMIGGGGGGGGGGSSGDDHHDDGWKMQLRTLTFLEAAVTEDEWWSDKKVDSTRLFKAIRSLPALENLYVSLDVLKLEPITTNSRGEELKDYSFSSFFM